MQTYAVFITVSFKMCLDVVIIAIAIALFLAAKAFLIVYNVEYLLSRRRILNDLRVS